MAKQVVNLGTSANKGDGDPLRTAFTKVNSNFTELYASVGTLDGDVTGSVFADDSTLLVDGVAGKIVGPIESTSILPGNGATDIGSTGNRFYNAWFTGQIATDSVLATILYGPLTGNVTGNVSGTAGAVAFSGITSKPTTLAGYGITDAATSAQGTTADSALQSVAFTDLTTTPTTLAGYGITDAQVSGALTDGDIKGSVFADDSTLLVDGVAGKIVGPIETTSLRTSETGIALGSTAGAINQGYAAVAVGSGAAGGNQGAEGVAIGLLAGSVNQGAGAVAISNAGTGFQGAQAIAIGYTAGSTYQGIKAIAVGFLAGGNNQGASAIAIGDEAGTGGEATATYVSGGVASTTLVLNNVINIVVGMRVTGTGFTHTDLDLQQTVVSVVDATTVTLSAVANGGTPSGTLTFKGQQSSLAVAIGQKAGKTSQGQKAVAIGKQAGLYNQGGYGVAIGSNAGIISQGDYGIGIGNQAGKERQGTNGVAVGFVAGKTDQGQQAIAIGTAAGSTTQGDAAVAIGHLSGQSAQGSSAIAIGYAAGSTNQHANSIVLNATGTALQTIQASSFVVKPIRSATMTTILGYDAASGEVTHNAAIPGYISLADLRTEVAASADFAAFKDRIAAL